MNTAKSFRFRVASLTTPELSSVAANAVSRIRLRPREYSFISSRTRGSTDAVGRMRTTSAAVPYRLAPVEGLLHGQRLLETAGIRADVLELEEGLRSDSELVSVLANFTIQERARSLVMVCPCHHPVDEDVGVDPNDQGRETISSKTSSLVHGRRRRPLA